MLLLVLAHRHVGGVIEQNVGRHQVRIDVEPGRRILAVLAGLLLELGHAVEPAEPRHAVEDPGELGVAGHLALIEDDVAVGVDARGDEGRGHLVRVVGELVGVLEHGDGVEIDHAIKAVMLGLQRHEFGDGAEIVAEMQIARGLHAREHAGLACLHCQPLLRRQRLDASVLTPAPYRLAPAARQGFDAQAPRKLASSVFSLTAPNSSAAAP